MRTFKVGDRVAVYIGTRETGTIRAMGGEYLFGAIDIELDVHDNALDKTYMSRVYCHPK